MKLAKTRRAAEEQYRALSLDLEFAGARVLSGRKPLPSPLVRGMERRYRQARDIFEYGLVFHVRSRITNAMNRVLARGVPSPASEGRLKKLFFMAGALGPDLRDCPECGVFHKTSPCRHYPASEEQP